MEMSQYPQDTATRGSDESHNSYLDLGSIIGSLDMLGFIGCEATYATVMACIVANTATGSPAWALWQSMLHDTAWQAAAVEASGPTDTPADKKKVN